MREKRIRIRLLEHKDGELLMAISPDMKGLVVHGYSEEEITQKLPGAIRDLLEADGYNVAHVELLPDRENAVEDFGPPAFIASASLAAACL